MPFIYINSSGGVVDSCSWVKFWLVSCVLGLKLKVDM